MKILMQNCFNHLYLKSDSEWTHHISEAKSFESSEKALAYCVEHQIPRVQVVLKFENDKYDVRMPITPECEDAAASQSTLRK